MSIHQQEEGVAPSPATATHPRPGPAPPLALPDVTACSQRGGYAGDYEPGGHKGCPLPGKGRAAVTNRGDYRPPSLPRTVSYGLMELWFLIQQV